MYDTQSRVDLGKTVYAKQGFKPFPFQMSGKREEVILSLYDTHWVMVISAFDGQLSIVIQIPKNYDRNYVEKQIKKLLTSGLKLKVAKRPIGLSMSGKEEFLPLEIAK